MAEAGNLHKVQYEFAAYLRDPDNAPPPADIEARRMAIYRDLFFNNVRNMLAGNFPVLSDLLGEERWAMLVRDFYRDHQSRSPLFPDMPREFLHYLAEERPEGLKTDKEPDPLFMYELAHYEWVESGLMLAEDQTPKDANPDGDLLEEVPVISSVAWLLAYNWPVNEIGREHQPEEPSEQPLYYLVYRNAEEKIIFAKFNAAAARLFEILNTENAPTGRKAIEQLAAEMQHPDPDSVLSTGIRVLENWKDRGVIAGTTSDPR